MKRRSFLQLFGLAPAAAIIAPVLAKADQADADLAEITKVAVDDLDRLVSTHATSGRSVDVSTAEMLERYQDEAEAPSFLGVHQKEDGAFVIVGDSGEIQTSEDGVNWTRREPGPTPVVVRTREDADRLFGKGWGAGWFPEDNGPPIHFALHTADEDG